MSRPLYADINLQALQHNYHLAQQCAPNAKAIAIVKADAYGHGAVQVAQALVNDAPAFGVATIEEALTLREASIQTPILLLEGFFESSEIELLHEHQLWCSLHSEWQLQMLEACDQEGNLTLWLKVDSGMHRLGFCPDDALAQVIERLKGLKAVGQLGLMTHFARADEADNPYTSQQIELMKVLAAQYQLPLCIANSPATMQFPEAQGDWVRPGIMLYGASPLPTGHPVGDQLQTVMTLRSKLISVRDLPAGEPIGYGGRFVTPQTPTRIGVVAAGYGDGYPRHAVDGTPVLVNGQRVPLAGRVSMDMLTVDLSDQPNAQPGDDVVLWGEGLDINEVAASCDTISYTLMTGLLPRVPRRYR